MAKERKADDGEGRQEVEAVWEQQNLVAGVGECACVQSQSAQSHHSHSTQSPSAPATQSAHLTAHCCSHSHADGGNEARRTCGILKKQTGMNVKHGIEVRWAAPTPDTKGRPNFGNQPFRELMHILGHQNAHSDTPPPRPGPQQRALLESLSAEEDGGGERLGRR